MSANNFDGDDLSRDTDGIAVQVDEADRSELTERVTLLTKENERLREENERLRGGNTPNGSPYRRMGLCLALLGALSGLAAIVFRDSQGVLFAIGATGLFGGLLTYYLSYGRFLDAAVCEGIYTAVATNGATIADELSLRDEHIYVPDGRDGARLFVPERSEYDVPDTLDGSICGDDSRQEGVILESTGAGLLREFDRTLSDDLPDAPPELAVSLADALVEQFELAERVDPSVDYADGRGSATIAISGSALGDVDRFDHPIASFLAVGFAAGLERPVSLEVTPGDDRTEWVVNCQWNASDDDTDP
ncbi:hypothetical protein [Natrinema amylolyticum]|uniref:hypothetical protein n=1 Tax=Natrinema amylolyticum TaxID=2878679 RepID=UPI001CF9370E|nr:hypothetical protein [Natrinema amylolyticum]